MEQICTQLLESHLLLSLLRSLLLSSPPQMRHPGMYSQEEPTSLHPARTPVAVSGQVRGRSSAEGREAMHSRSRTQQKGEARQGKTGGHVLPARLGTQTVPGAECCNCHGKHQSAMACQSLQPELTHNYMSSARARKPGD